MNRVVLISCTLEKLNYKSKAKKLYSPSPNFVNNLKYAYTLNPDKIFIISAKHHVLELDDEIEPYNLSIDELNKKEKIEWKNKVINQLKNKKINLEIDEIFTILPHDYLELISQHIKNRKI